MRQKQIINQLNTILISWLEDEGSLRSYKIGDAKKLPPFYEILALEGEGIFLQRFFRELPDKQTFDLTPQDWLDFYYNYADSGGYIQDFISRTYWLTILSQGAELPQIDREISKKFYFILLAILQRRAPQLLTLAIDQLFLTLWKQQFPNKSNSIKRFDVTQLRHKLKVRLNKYFSLACEVKESFVQTEDQVEFKLLYRKVNDKAWQPLICLQRPRLKTARIAAYLALLEDNGVEQVLDNER
ncbi:hypothetical protein BMT54_11210 [Pasteurellaceae bacterium 15-036681]|nr:hypothetical protein BMT54_11210 [Pasteurellaceae bacterium 15-036681]